MNATPTEPDRTTTGPAPRTWGALGVGLALLLFAATSLGLLFASGALDSGFGDHEDEPGHLLSSLLIHDYVVSGLSESPVAYAKDYYLHYPKVTLGHWPPTLPMMTATWMWIVGDGTTSILLLYAALAFAISAAMYLGTRRFVGDVPAALMAVLFPCAPLVQTFGHHVMTELPLALFGTLAVLHFGRFVEEGKLRNSLYFGVFATLGILTKGSALALALVPLPAIALAGRWELLRRPALWISALIPALFCVPWYVATLGISTSSWAGGSTPTVEHTLLAAVEYPLGLLEAAGWGAGIAAVVGWFAALGAARRAERFGSLAIWLPCAVLPYVLVPTGVQMRHLIPALPACLMLAGLGLACIARRWPSFALGKVHVASLAILLAFAPHWTLARKDVHGYVEAARDLLAQPELAEAVLLIESDATGEGAFISAVALAEARPGHIVLRGSKMLGASDWMGKDYRTLFETSDDVQAWLAETPVDVVLIDESEARDHRHPHVDQLLQAIAQHPESWQSLGTYDLERDGGRYPGSLLIYRQLVPADHPRPELTFDQVVGRSLPE